MATVKCCLKPKNKRFEHEDKYKGCPIQVRNHNPQYCLRCKSNGDNDGILSALIPGRVFYVLIGFALAFDSSEVPLTTLLQQGMLTNILTCSVLGNLLWLGVNLALRGTPFSKTVSG